MTSPARCFGCDTTNIDPVEDWVRFRADSRYVFFLCGKCGEEKPTIGWEGPIPFIASWKKAA